MTWQFDHLEKPGVKFSKSQSDLTTPVLGNVFHNLTRGIASAHRTEPEPVVESQGT